MQRSALCRSRRELSSAYFLAKFGFDTAENEPCEVCPLTAYRSPQVTSRSGAQTGSGDTGARIEKNTHELLIPLNPGCRRHFLFPPTSFSFRSCSNFRAGYASRCTTSTAGWVVHYQMVIAKRFHEWRVDIDKHFGYILRPTRGAERLRLHEFSALVKWRGSDHAEKVHA